MPKMKTHKGAAKRFKITKKGKVKHYNQGHSHLQSGISAKRRRRMRKPSTMTNTQAKNVRRMIEGAG